MHSRVVCVLPVRGRAAQTLANAAQLRASAGIAATWLAIGATPDRSTLDALGRAGWRVLLAHTERLTYWQALAAAMARTTEAWMVNLANDLTGADGWLAAALACGDESLRGLIGFAGDGHPETHSCHMLIRRTFLQSLGGWPVWYDHNFGDTELCVRAQELGAYIKCATAVLHHQHPALGHGTDDAVYREGRACWDRDQACYAWRRRHGWACSS